MEIITFQIDRRALLALSCLLLGLAILSVLEEKRRKRMCIAIMERQDQLEKGLLNVSLLSLMAVEQTQEKQAAAQPKKTVPARRKSK